MLTLVGIESKVARCFANGGLLLGTIIGGWWAVEARNDGRYVLAAEYAQSQKELRGELRGLHTEQLQAHRAVLRRELFDIEREATLGSLSPALVQRRIDLLDEVSRINAKLIAVDKP